jgi:hypothetical protein
MFWEDDGMRVRFAEIFGTDKFIIGGVHLLALPGTPGYDSAGSLNKIIDRAIADARKLERGGVDGILFANEADTPYLQHVGAEIVAAFTRCIVEVTRETHLPFGINMLLDPVAAIGIAHATGGQFVRGYFTGSYIGDTSFMDSQGATAIRLRRNIGAENVSVVANITCGFGASLDPRELADIAHGAVVHGRVDAIAVSGLAAGKEPNVETLTKAAQGAPGIPLIVGTGVHIGNVHKLLSVADGAIVATALRENGKTLNPVDSVRVMEFMEAVRAIRKR